ncbi:hypothetical protein [Halobellus rubicundus]|uniref:Uncharacterized protein n=1 Tax=Halobellus rubicundus TaxID=2996466 RepID=A0ABD5M7Y3_9EURY
MGIDWPLRDLFRRYWIRVRNKLILANNRRRNWIRIEKEGHLPKIVVHETHETKVKWTGRVLTLIGVITSIISIRSPFGIGLSIGLIIIEQILERIVLSITSAFVHPLPEKWDNSTWEGNLYVGTPSGWSIGVIFSEKEMAEAFFETLYKWNNGESTDREENIICSFVDRGDTYTTIILPSPQREPAKAAAKEIEQEQIEQGKIRDHHQLLFQIVFYKNFPNPPDAHFREFKNRYSGDGLTLFPVLMTESVRRAGPANGLPPGLQLIDDIPEIELENITISELSDLDENDVEYQFIRLALEEIELEH